MVLRVILQIAVAVFLLAGTVRAGDDAKLSGSSISLKDAVASSTNIVIAKITELGGIVAGDLNNDYYYGAKISILRTLKGTYFEKRTDCPMYGVNHSLGADKEYPPTAGETYIIILCKEPGGLKIIPATNENTATVKKLISN